jgi:hypothetical protein
MDRQQKALDYFQNLYLIAIADGNLQENERTFLVQVAKQMGLSLRETANIMMNNASLDFIVPETLEEQTAQLEDVIMMMTIDSKIQDKEYDLCLKFAQRIGVPKHEFEKLVMEVINRN